MYHAPDQEAGESTLAWTDAPGPMTANRVGVNDLDLVVRQAVAPTGATCSQAAVSRTGGDADPRNNLESVILPSRHDVLGRDLRQGRGVGNGVPERR